jgi:hypothetical protein
MQRVQPGVACADVFRRSKRRCAKDKHFGVRCAEIRFGFQAFSGRKHDVSGRNSGKTARYRADCRSSGFLSGRKSLQCPRQFGLRRRTRMRATHHPGEETPETDERLPHSGRLSCLRQGSSTFFVLSIASARAMRRRVECGMITSSI